MARSYLELRFEDDGDGTGKLLAHAQVGGFAGEGGAYFSVAEVEAFAIKLTAFPLPDQPRVSLAGGFWKKDKSGELDQELLALSAYPIGRRGYVGIQIRMATEIWNRPEFQQAARLELITSYAPLDRFSGKLIALVRGRADEAVLEGEDPIY